MLLASWPRPNCSNDRVMSENASRCCLLILSTSCGSAVCDYEGRAALSSSSPWQRSRRTFGGGQARRPATTVSPCVRSVRWTLEPC
jgi:hypothetical protein